ncbi:HSP20-like chaperone [Mycena metata]|uniref:HSP20-like chaperone n=1 Tax=Mycena metata TaxID=1033252 RepID=A0AAD7NLY9_9AGAR|nr:HSP20-like chaperone [Mycena metata]
MSPVRNTALDVREIATLLAGIQTGRLRVVNTSGHPSGTVFRPRMDVCDDLESGTTIATFEVPGVKISELSISVKQGILLVWGQRLSQHRSSRLHPSLRGLISPENDTDSSSAHGDSSNRRWTCRELRYGSFYRKLRLPPGIELSCITANLCDGLLTVRWPRSLSEIPHSPRSHSIPDPHDEPNDSGPSSPGSK